MLTDAEIIEMEQLIKAVEVDKRRFGLSHITDQTPKNYKILYEAFTQQKYVDERLVAGAKGVVLEGSGRSRKTFSVADFMIYICTEVETNCVFNIVKDTFANIKLTLYNEISTALEEHGLPNPFTRLTVVESFKIGKNKINFIGAENADKFDGLTSDYLYFNEAINIQNKQSVKNAMMRCSKFWIMDYNPKLTQHWIYEEVIPRDDVWWLRTTFRDNPLVPLQQKLEILAYEPWESGTYEIVNNSEVWYNGEPITETNQPPPHLDNIRQGTADKYNWLVFGLGLRGAMQGVIFNAVWINLEEKPDWQPIHTLDFGFTNDPTAGCNYWEDENNIWIEPLMYQPIDMDDILSNSCDAVGMERGNPMICDSSDKYTSEDKGSVRMVMSLRDKFGWVHARKISKTKSVVYWIGSMKKKKIHIVRNHLYKHIKSETENYRWKEINGIAINQPEDSYNHFWDSARYGHMSYNTKLDPTTYWS